MKGEEGGQQLQWKFPDLFDIIDSGQFITTSATPSGGLVRSSPKMADYKSG